MTRTLVQTSTGTGALAVLMPGPCEKLLTATASETDTSTPTLSALLREKTAPLHEEIETLLGLPGAIRTPDDYPAWLGRFLGIYEPLECTLAAFTEWGGAGISPPARDHAACLAADLIALGADPAAVPRTEPAWLPLLPAFPYALGALYVLEGATLGGRVILRDLEARIGPSIDGATSFFGGRGDTAGPMWKNFRAALDRFGLERPLDRDHVVEGAERTFRAILAWFEPFRAACGSRP